MNKTQNKTNTTTEMEIIIIIVVVSVFVEIPCVSCFRKITTYMSKEVTQKKRN
jgi:hypothetical protein